MIRRSQVKNSFVYYIPLLVMLADDDSSNSTVNVARTLDSIVRELSEAQETLDVDQG